MHFVIFSIKFIFIIILTEGLIRSSNADAIGILSDCDTGRFPSLCVPHTLCQRNENITHLNDDKCGRDPNGTPQVCCARSNLLLRSVDGLPAMSKKSLTERMCDEYHKPGEAVTDDEKGLTREFPYAYTLGWKVENDPYNKIRYACIATLVSARYLLTTASCLDDNEGLPSLVRAADTDRISARDYEIAECIKHPDYKSSYAVLKISRSDIALIKLVKPIAPSRTSGVPACFWTGVTIEDQTDVIALGYLPTSLAGFSEDLLNVTLKVHQKNECEEDYSPLDRLFFSRKKGEYNVICAVNPDNPRDACQVQHLYVEAYKRLNNFPFQHHFGGPLIAIINEIPFIVGISLGCLPGKPAMYFMISKYISWMERYIWPDYY
uniref:Peptidase S1 domain-containing protein n=1 Tax=Glossina palpalis gambiensis TaxID=67801 RepID=A0A1B0AZG5_9MUSC